MSQTDDPESMRPGGPSVRSSRVLCKEITQSGDPCPANKMRDSDFCFWHDPRPEYIQRQAEARNKGGLTSGRKRRYVKGIREPIEDIDEVRKKLEEVVANLRQMDQTIGTCNSLIRALQVYHGILTDQADREEILQTINELREAMGLDEPA